MATSGFRLRASRALLFCGGVALLIVAIYHAAGYVTTSIAVGNSGLSVELRDQFKALWLGFSLQALITALVVFAGALRPQSISAAVLLICALLPGLNAAVLFRYVGSTFGPILLLLSTCLVIAGAALRPRTAPAPAVQAPPAPAPETPHG
jgi:hypothetical protein